MVWDHLREKLWLHPYRLPFNWLSLSLDMSIFIFVKKVHQKNLSTCYIWLIFVCKKGLFLCHEITGFPNGIFYLLWAHWYFDLWIWKLNSSSDTNFSSLLLSVSLFSLWTWRTMYKEKNILSELLICPYYVFL